MNPPSERQDYSASAQTVKLNPQQIQADTHRLRLERAQRIAEDDLRQRIIEALPEIRHEVYKMEAVLRELIEGERSKMPPEAGYGYFVLNQDNRSTYSGQGNIGPKKYRAKAIVAKDPNANEILKITMSPM